MHGIKEEGEKIGTIYIIMNIIPVDTGSEKAPVVITVFFDNSMVFSLKEHYCTVKRENLCGHDLWVMLKVYAVKMKVTRRNSLASEL